MPRLRFASPDEGKSVREIARLLKVSEPTVYRYLAAARA
ncbi:helix-turn-helix domain-containing protein [Leifsonia sp. 21MFCrub1.1]